MSTTIDMRKKAENYKKSQEEMHHTKHYDEMQKQMKKICELIFHYDGEFNKKEFYMAVCEYIDKNDRLLYKTISNYVYSVCDMPLNGVQIDEIQKNLVDSVEYVMSYDEDQLNEDTKNKYGKNIHEKARKVVIKIQDHVDLAIQQHNSLKETDEEYKRKFQKEFKETKDVITREMSNQLVTLVGIFTAIAFVVFGGISSLDNIFQAGMYNIPLLRLMIIGVIWGLCMTDLVYIFLFCVGKITKLSIKSSDKPEDNLVQKYPIIFWSNYLFLSILGILSWMYFLCKKDLINWFFNIADKSSVEVSVVGFIIILILMLFGAWKLIDLRKEKNN